MWYGWMFLFSVERLDERIADMKREYHTLHERHSEVSTESGYMEAFHHALCIQLIST